MSRIKKVALSAALSISALAAMASSAAASDVVACQFSGLAGALNPPIPAAAHDPGGINTLETGTYHLGANATCAKADSDPGQNGNSRRYDASITSDGVWENYLCGTGDWYEGYFQTYPRSMIISSGDAGWEGPLRAVYWIDFRADQGKMTIDDFAVMGDPLSPGGKHGSGSGVVNITPTMGGDCVLNDVVYYQVTGAFVAVA